MIAKTKLGNAWYYDWYSIHAPLTEVYPCATEILMDQYEGKLTTREDQQHLWISRKTLIPFLRWVAERGTTQAARFLYDIETSIAKIFNKCAPCRGTSVDRRVPDKNTSAKYAKDCCTQAFDIDHIVELARGGTDTLDNLQALCVQCHAIKTRS